MQAQDILQFWFEALTPAQQFAKDAALDDLIRTRFGPTLVAAARCELWAWRATPQGRLAEIVVLDQFSRNAYRDTPAAFAQDPLALALAQELVASGHAHTLPPAQRAFAYMPYMHSESLAIQAQSLTFDLHTATQALAPFDWVDVFPLLKQGTVVRMDLALDTTRTAQAVYQRYFSPDEVGGDAFHTTEVPVRLAQLSSQLTSRSQGKWVVERATQFKTVVLDFEGVAMAGQGFIDEVFRVFATAHPQVRLKPIHLTPAVAQAMAMFAPHVQLPGIAPVSGSAPAPEHPNQQDSESE